jgi:hypothetical protein
MFIDIIVHVPIFSRPSDHWQFMTRRVGRPKRVDTHDCSGAIFSRLSNPRGVHCNNIRKQCAGKYRVIYIHKRKNLEFS